MEKRIPHTCNIGATLVIRVEYCNELLFDWYFICWAGRASVSRELCVFSRRYTGIYFYLGAHALSSVQNIYTHLVEYRHRHPRVATSCCRAFRFSFDGSWSLRKSSYLDSQFHHWDRTLTQSSLKRNSVIPFFFSFEKKKRNETHVINQGQRYLMFFFLDFTI